MTPTQYKLFQETFKVIAGTPEGSPEDFLMALTGALSYISQATQDPAMYLTRAINVLMSEVKNPHFKR